MVIEKKDAEHAEFTTMATVGAADRLFFLRNLLPGHYEFRAFTTDGKDKSPASLPSSSISDGLHCRNRNACRSCAPRPTRPS